MPNFVKAMDNYRSGQNRTNEMIQAQMWFGATGGGKKSFTHHECWEVVKYCKRFVIIPTGPEVVLNETPLRDSMTSDSPLDSPMSQDSPIEKEPRPIGRKAAKAKKKGNSSNQNSQFLEEIARQNGIRIEMEQKRQDHELALEAEYAREREYLRKKIWTRQIGKPWRWIQMIQAQMWFGATGVAKKVSPIMNVGRW
ncbi:zinc ion-binding protein [Prunus dulcis]|uniref:Zinc ion-binding protein n=1 Tax=Prunus dulcis TaxID=3755 RepID=A0A4Y1RUF3_PRUDU|nr:zinc ion-binding protein [Prunus dulcis]